MCDNSSSQLINVRLFVLLRCKSMSLDKIPRIDKILPIAWQLLSFFVILQKYLTIMVMSVNKVILIGNVGKEPDVRHLDRNVVVANMVLATTERSYTLQNGTQVPERTEWHNVVLWGGLAEVAEKYVHKGDRIYVEGKIRTNTYEDQNGIRRYRTEILAETMEMLSSKGVAATDAAPSGAPF